MDFLGRNGTQVAFSSDGTSVVVDESSNAILSIDLEPVIASSSYWNPDGPRPSKLSEELANAALTNLDITVFSSSDRMHTIPKAVVAEAKRGLEWRKEHKRGGTPVGMNTARTLAKGGQIGIRKIRHIAKYFPRHEVDKKGKGYKPGQDGYPSKGRIAWALWGGDAAQRWASAIVERENKKENSSLVAANGYYDFEKPQLVDTRSFEDEGVKYMVRVRMDGSGIDRLYAIKPCGTVLVWDDGCWDDLGNIEHDIDTYDKTLDDPYDNVTKLHVLIEPEAAITVAALFDANPFAVRSMHEVAPQEAEMFEKAKPYLNYSDMGAMVAAPGFKTDQDGNYTSAERSEKATSQLRDALGRFAVTGSRVIVGKDPTLSGRILSQDGDQQKVKVELDDGRTIDVAANQTQQEDTYEPDVEQGRQQATGGGPGLFDSNPIDTSGILAEPRTPVGFGATMPGTLPPLTPGSLQTMLNDFPAWVSAQRTAPDSAENSPSGGQGRIVPEWSPSEEKEDRWYDDPNKKIKNAMNHPMLRNFLDNPDNRGWYTYDIGSPDKVQKQKSKKEVNKSNYKDWLGDRGKVKKDGTVVAAAGKEEEFKSPRESDVAPMYMAIVAEDDPQAVMNVIALVPKSKTSTSPKVFKRDPGQWVPEQSILQDLQSPTPPPVVMLDTETLEEVVKQIDGPKVAAEKKMAAAEKDKSVTAAAGINHAENLRKYWLNGPGGQKIRWGTPGDFDRCVDHVSKFLGPRAKSYCALQYKAATDQWAGALTASIVPTEEEFLDKIVMIARRKDAKSRMSLTAGGYDSSHYGSKFYIPLVIPEDIESGDGRMFKKGSIKMRELPLPLLWQIKTGDGHNGSVVVGKIDRMERTDHGIGHAYGVFDGGIYGREAERLVKGGFIRGVSADLDQFEADQEDSEAGEGSDNKIENGKIKISKARVMAVTLVPKPAFQECQIKIVDSMSTQEEEMIPDGVYVDDVGDEDASSLVACGIVAGVIPTTPPAEWFENPKLKQATPLTVDDDGRVFGHIAAWHVDHIGMSFGTKPPRSRSKYSYFHTGVVRTQEGTDVPVGQLTLAGGHAPLEASAQDAVRHYDDTASAIADVHAGEDAYGIWVAGSLRPGSTPEQIRSLRASAPSGDWRPIKGHLELVAVCQVNVPGFPIARSRVASGQVMALVAAGANTLARMKSDPYAELHARLDKLEKKDQEPLLAAAAEAKERFSSMVLAAKAEELSARVKEVDESTFAYMLQTMDQDDDDEAEMAVISRRVRKRLAKEGKALPDGSFPIRNINDLRNAIKAYGRAKPGKRAAVRRHIVKRARGLKRRDLVPEKWKEAALDDVPENGMTAAKGDPCWEGYVMVGMKTVDGKEVPNCVPKDAAASEALEAAVTAAAPGECPPATQDIALNLKNRKNAIDTAMYGPLNPAEPNEEYWSTLGDEWGVDVETAKQQRCGNCAVFVISPSMKDCISSGLTDNADEFDAIDSAGELGYCEAFDFKCASARTCRAWVGGGPVTEDKPVTSAGVAYDVNDGPEAVDSPKAQRESEEEGLALPDGSYRIANEQDLKRALWAYGRWPNKRSGRARAHIIKRAKALGKKDMLPDIWPGAYNSSKKTGEFSLKERAEIAASMVAAGGLDRNRGNAERLRRYWTKGPGALKIRWNTPGDWKRCVRYLSKYMGPRAKGYCQLRHKEATGVYTGSKLNPGRRKGRNNSVFSAFTEQEFGILESLYGDITQFSTEVSEFDMMMPIYKIMEERDQLYDVLWEPDEWVVVLLMDDKNTATDVEPMGEDYSEDLGYEDFDADGFDDFGLDNYEDDGLFATKEDMPEPSIDDDEGDEDLEDMDYSDNPATDPSEQIDDGEDNDPALAEERKNIAKKTKFRFEGGKYTADTQPRDAQGRFRKVLARLKVDLGAAGASRAIEKIEEAENLDFAGDYGRAAEAAGDLINIIDRLDTGALNPESIENVREGSRELGEVISNLPFAFGEQAEKVRFSDLPPALRDLIEDMITRVEAKIGPEDAAEATKGLKSFMSGGDFYSQGDISSQMAKMLRLLT